MKGYELEIINGYCELCDMNFRSHKVYHHVESGLEAHARWTINGTRYKVFVNGVEMMA